MKSAKDLEIKLCFPSSKLVSFSSNLEDVSGIFAGPVKAILRVLKGSFKNITFIKPDATSNAADLTAGKLSGCWGALQRGEADVYLYPHRMPIMGLENITQLNTSSLQSGTYMLAPYSINEKSEVLLSPLNSLNTVSVDTWANGVVMIILFAVIMLYMKLFVYKRPASDDSSSRLRQDPREEDEALHGQSLLYQVITHMMQYETCDYSGYSVRYMSLLMSIFAFLFITLFSCMITCDKVSTHDIQVYDTYDKILANKSIQPVWVQDLNDYDAYKNAAKGSLQAKLWQQSIAISKRDPERPALFDTSPGMVLKKVQNARSKRFVIFLSNMFTKLLMSVLCTAMSTDYDGIKSFIDLRLKGNLDKHVITSVYVLPLSMHSTIGKQADHALRRSLEAQLFSQPDFAHMIALHVAKEFLGGRISYNQQHFQCLDFEKLPAGESEAGPLELVNANNVFRWWAYGCFASLVVFLLEHSCHPCHETRSKGGARH